MRLFVFCLVVVVGGCLAQLRLGVCFLGCGLCLGVFGVCVLVVQVVASCFFPVEETIRLQKQIDNFWLLSVIFCYWFAD